MQSICERKPQLINLTTCWTGLPFRGEGKLFTVCHSTKVIHMNQLHHKAKLLTKILSQSYDQRHLEMNTRILTSLSSINQQPASSSFLNSLVKVWITLSNFKVFPWYVQHFVILPHPPHPPPAYRCSLRVMSLPVSSDVTQAITSWCGTHPFHGWTWRNLSWNINGQKQFIKSILSWLVSYCLSLTFYFFKSRRFLFRSIGPVGFFSHGVVGEPIH